MSQALSARLAFLLETVALEARHLQATDARLFAEPFTADRAARLGILATDSEHWMAARALRNRMVNDYIRNAALLAEAVNAAHAAVPMLVGFAEACRAYAEARGIAGA